MARLGVQTEVVSGIVSPQKIPCPVGWQKAERSVIRTKIISRDPNIGVIDVSQLIIREWTGYWYLLRDEYVYDNGAIEFKQQVLYDDHQIWLLEGNIQQGGVRVPIPETTQPEENLEELAEWFLFAGESAVAIAETIPIPGIGDLIEQALQLLENISSEDLTYLPTPFRPDTFALSFPAGEAELEVEFIWWPYSPVSFVGGVGEFSIEDQIEIPELTEGDPLEEESQVVLFEERATRYTCDNFEDIAAVCDAADNGGEPPVDPFPETETGGVYTVSYEFVQTNADGVEVLRTPETKSVQGKLYELTAEVRGSVWCIQVQDEQFDPSLCDSFIGRAGQFFAFENTVITTVVPPP